MLKGDVRVIGYIKNRMLVQDDEGTTQNIHLKHFNKIIHLLKDGLFKVESGIEWVKTHLGGIPSVAPKSLLAPKREGTVKYKEDRIPKIVNGNLRFEGTFSTRGHVWAIYKIEECSTPSLVGSTFKTDIIDVSRKFMCVPHEFTGNIKFKSAGKWLTFTFETKNSSLHATDRDVKILKQIAKVVK